jgi:predicted PurR-regulated permease PerM
MKNYKDYAFLGVIAVLLVIVFFIVRPFFIPILTSIVLAYIFYPLYRLLKKAVRFPSFAAILVSIIILLLVTLPIIFIVNSIAQEAQNTYATIKEGIESGTLENCTDSSLTCMGFKYLGKYISDENVQSYIASTLNRFSGVLISAANKFVFSIPHYILNFFIMLFILFFLLKDGEAIVQRMKRLMPFTDSHTKSIVLQLKSVTGAVVYGHVLVSAGQAFIGGLAFWIFGVPSPLVWGFVMFFLALIPFLGTPLVWVPAAVIKLLTNSPGQAIGIIIVGVFISTADNFIKPKIVADRAKIHPIVVLLGVLGGIPIFGLIGIIIGPVILSVFVRLVEIYEEEHVEIKSNGHGHSDRRTARRSNE